MGRAAAGARAHTRRAGAPTACRHARRRQELMPSLAASLPLWLPPPNTSFKYPCNLQHLRRRRPPAPARGAGGRPGEPAHRCVVPWRAVWLGAGVARPRRSCWWRHRHLCCRCISSTPPAPHPPALPSRRSSCQPMHSSASMPAQTCGWAAQQAQRARWATLLRRARPTATPAPTGSTSLRPEAAREPSPCPARPAG